MLQRRRSRSRAASTPRREVRRAAPRRPGAAAGGLVRSGRRRYALGRHPRERLASWCSPRSSKPVRRLARGDGSVRFRCSPATSAHLASRVLGCPEFRAGNGAGGRPPHWPRLKRPNPPGPAEDVAPRAPPVFGTFSAPRRAGPRSLPNVCAVPRFVAEHGAAAWMAVNADSPPRRKKPRQPRPPPSRPPSHAPSRRPELPLTRPQSLGVVSSSAQLSVDGVPRPVRSAELERDVRQRRCEHLLDRPVAPVLDLRLIRLRDRPLKTAAHGIQDLVVER